MKDSSKIKDERIKIINAIIKKLEEIRDREEINEIIISPYEEVEEFKRLDGTTYVVLQTSFSIRHMRLYQKGDEFDSFSYKEVK